MNTVLKNVVLLPNLSKQIDPVLVQKLILRMKEAGCVIRSDVACREFLSPIAECAYFEDDSALMDGADVIFVLGGDGSIIQAAHRSVGLGIPIVAINCGRLGYMAEIEIGELELVDQVLAGVGTIEERMMLHVEVHRGEGILTFTAPALNDVVLTNGPIPRLLYFALVCDGELVEHCYADGMILSTPTGSTAYSMAAGGPVLDPRLDCICATPICPQTMNNHPIIFSGNSVLEIRNIKSNGNVIYLSEDGRESMSLQENDCIRITHSSCRIPLIRIKKGGSLSALRRKLS